MCIQITGTGSGSGGSPVTGTFTVFVNNECPSCAANSIDLGKDGDGVWDISWKAVPCPCGSAKFQYTYQGTNAYYIKIQVRNHCVPVSGVSINSQGSWVALTRQPDNFWQTSGAVYPLPTAPSTFQIKVTSIYGDSVTDSITWSASGTINGNVQFPNCGSSSSSSSTVATSTTSSSTTAKPTTSTSTSTSTTSSSTTVKPTSTSTVSTTSTSTTGSAVANIIVYDDALQNSFQDWSWGTHSITNTSPVHGGTKSISYTPGASAAYDAIYFYKAAFISTSLHTGISFWVNGGTTGSQNLKISLVVYNSSSSNSVLTGPAPSVGSILTGASKIPTNGWAQGYILSYLTSFSPLTGLLLLLSF
eukprot:TRINITY_DN3680_c0_g2_i2.p1 TRINITY_DN3680_c0_g2~~TRINITY_DN3680_c0_g2_i2.p1  ORF type:complete len:360 (-),score=79.20 TRINITY_DN3680_c0_g2_i2:61-1140(-)